MRESARGNARACPLPDIDEYDFSDDYVPLAFAPDPGRELDGQGEYEDDGDYHVETEK